MTSIERDKKGITPNKIEFTMELEIDNYQIFGCLYFFQ